MTRSAALVRDATVERWPEATHWTLHDEPDRLALRLKAFLVQNREGLAAK